MLSNANQKRPNKKQVNAFESGPDNPDQSNESIRVGNAGKRNVSANRELEPCISRVRRHAGRDSFAFDRTNRFEGRRES